MNLTPWRKTPKVGEDLERSGNDIPLSFNDYLQMVYSSFSYNGIRYTLPGADQEEITGNFQSLTQQAYKSNGVVFACMATRMLLFTEARFKFRQVRTSGPGDLFGTPDLIDLERPWPNGNTSDLLKRAITDADLGGNFFAARRPGGGLVRLRPDWVTIVLGSFQDPDVKAWDPDAVVVGYIYTPGGKNSGHEPITYEVADVAHWAPYSDPEAQFRGMSWLSPLVREVMADKQMVDHKLAFFENGATPNLIVKMDMPDVDKAQPWIDLFRTNHEGALNAYKTIFLGGGADASVVGADLQQLDFKVTQGAGETRIAAAARVPPIIVGLSEGLASATYSNYGQARRAFADATLRPMWRDLCSSMSAVINIPGGAELWYDDRDIAFIREDQADAAEIQATKSTSINTLITAGFTADTVVDAVVSGDFTRLEHSGLTSVQLLPPGTPGEPEKEDVAPTPDPTPDAPAPATPASANGNGNGRDEVDDLLGGLLREMRLREISEKLWTPAEPASQNISVSYPPQEAPVLKIEEGAIQSHVTVEPSSMELADGAIRVEPGDVRLEQGAIGVTVDPGDVHVHPSDVTVEPADVRMEIAEGAIQMNVEPSETHIDVQPAEVRSEVSIEEGAVQVTVEPSDVTVEPADVRMELAEGAVQVTVEPSDVSVEVAPTEVTVERDQVGGPEINITTPAPEITNHVHVPPPANKVVRFERDYDGNISQASSEDIPVDNSDEVPGEQPETD